MEWSPFRKGGFDGFCGLTGGGSRGGVGRWMHDALLGAIGCQSEPLIAFGFMECSGAISGNT